MEFTSEWSRRHRTWIAPVAMSDPVGQAALDRAFREKDLLLVYQPIHHARTRAIYGAEALTRQRRRSGEIREASVITEAAEEGPELFALDSWTVHTAYTDAAQWQAGGAPDVRLNVNLSPREFQEGDVLGRLRKLLTGCHLDPHTINLEITETSYIERPDETMNVLAELKKLGLHLWLDDFGTGHSSLEHLQHFALDGLKVPGSFVKELPADRRCRAITRSIIALAHELQLEVIAEEVERQEQLDFLLDCGCDYVQGFLFSKPMTRKELEEFLRGDR